MIKLLIGPALVGTGYAAGSFYGADSEQLVRKSPAATYAAVERALANIHHSGTTFFDGGTPMSYEIKVDRTDDERLVVTLLFDGQQGASADLIFAPRDNGQATLITTRIHGERSVLGTALAGTSKARLAYAPDWMLNLTAKPVLQQLAQQIEHGESASIGGSEAPDPRAQWEANLTPEQRGQVAAWQQYQATKPIVDPSAAAQNQGVN